MPVSAMRRPGACVLAAALACCASVLAESGRPANPPSGTERTGARAGSARGKPRADITPLIEIIRTTDQPAKAIAAYARANTLDRNNFDLLNAYLRRMLQLGLPQVAWRPANVLVHLAPEEGLAWAVVGYMHGRENRLTEAFSPTMRAISRLEGNRSVLFNAGQLAGWYDHQQVPPEVSHAARRILDDRRKQLAADPFFKRGYEAIAKAYRQLTQRNADLNKRITAMEAASREVRKLAVEIDGQMQDLSSDIDQRESEINRLDRELRYGYVSHGSGIRVTGGTLDGYYLRSSGYYRRRHDPYVRDQIREDIHDKEQEIARLRTKREALLREGLPVLEELRQKGAAIQKLRVEDTW